MEEDIENQDVEDEHLISDEEIKADETPDSEAEENIGASEDQADEE